MSKLFPKNTLTRKLFKSIFGSYFIFAVVITAVQVASEYFDAKNQIRESIARIGATVAPTIESSLWTYNDVEWHAVGNGLINLDEISGVIISNTQGPVFTSGNTADVDLKLERKLFFKDFDADVHHVGNLKLFSSNKLALHRVRYGFVLILINSIAKTTILWVLFILLVNRNVTTPLRRLMQAIRKIRLGQSGKIDWADPESLRQLSTRNDELGELAQKFIHFIDNINASQSQIESLKLHEARSELAAQIAHDIKSPLLALSTLKNNFDANNPEHKSLIKSSIERITAIAEDLQHKKHDKNSTAIGRVCLSDAISAVVTEKRFEYKDHLDLTIKTDFNPSCVNLSVMCHESSFERIMSNIINNAIEALPNHSGLVLIELDCDHQASLVVRVIDNGCGLPQDKIESAFAKGSSFGKDGTKHAGTGLGLYHAKTMIENWQGSIAMACNTTKGMTITITLPAVASPQNLSINKATVEQASAILELQKTAYQKEGQLYNDFNIPPLVQTLDELKDEFDTHEILIATRDDKIIGSVRAIEQNHVCHIGKLMVHPSEQKQGIGSLLMSRIESKFANSDAYELFVGARSQDNIEFYTKRGYHLTKVEKQSDKTDIAYMIKTNQGVLRA